MPDPLRLDRIGDHVALLTLNRPQARNAVDPALARALGDAVAATEADDAIRAVVLAGEGPVFCAGADLKAVAAGRADDLWTPRAALPASSTRRGPSPGSPPWRARLWPAAARSRSPAT